MKVVLINGSPRISGCTYTALSVVADALENAAIDTEIVLIGSNPFPAVLPAANALTLGTASSQVTR